MKIPYDPGFAEYTLNGYSPHYAPQSRATSRRAKIN
jgi:hypothetical protein